jgi:lantibiotic biosynthesis protein
VNIRRRAESPRVNDTTGDSWEPLLSAVEARSVFRIVESIAEKLRYTQVHSLDPGPTLLAFYLARAQSSPSGMREAKDLLYRALESTGDCGIRPGLYDGGFAGVGWLFAHLQSLVDPVDDGLFDDVDQALLARVQYAFDNYDFIGGAVGIGAYFIERQPSPTSTAVLSRLVRGLSATAVSLGAESTWATPAWLVAPSQRAQAPNGYYNLGVAHGVPGVIGFLAQALERHIEPEVARRLLVGSTQWLRSQWTESCWLPDFVTSSSIPSPDRRPVWCYGALGASMQLLQAGRVLHSDDLVDEAIRWATVMASSHVMLNDACLCHGAAGTAHIFNRLYQITRLERFREAALHWLNVTLAKRVEGQGIAGFRTFAPGEVTEGRSSAPWRTDGTFLTGASGTALALLAATGEDEPRWDSLLLCRPVG